MGEKYAIISCINGSFKVESEYTGNLDRAKSNFHELCKNLWNAADVEYAVVKIVDKNFMVVSNKEEYIIKDQQESE